MRTSNITCMNRIHQSQIRILEVFPHQFWLYEKVTNPCSRPAECRDGRKIKIGSLLKYKKNTLPRFGEIFGEEKHVDGPQIFWCWSG
jgi:hypothetical protein